MRVLFSSFTSLLSLLTIFSTLDFRIALLHFPFFSFPFLITFFFRPHFLHFPPLFISFFFGSGYIRKTDVLLISCSSCSPPDLCVLIFPAPPEEFESAQAFDTRIQCGGHDERGSPHRLDALRATRRRVCAIPTVQTSPGRSKLYCDLESRLCRIPEMKSCSRPQTWRERTIPQRFALWNYTLQWRTRLGKTTG